MSDGEYSVVLWFPNDTYHYERRWIGGQEAVELARDCINRPAAKAGFISKVVITDRDDNTSFLWKYKEGIVYPVRDPSGRFIGDA